jgi:hypothetical protein
MGYRHHLRAVVAASAAPYGYSLTIWSCAAVTAHKNGVPGAPGALLFLAGAVVAYGLVSVLAYGGPTEILRPHPDTAVQIWGALHFASVGVAIAITDLTVLLIPNPSVWFVVGMLATMTYLLLIAAQFVNASQAVPTPTATANAVASDSASALLAECDPVSRAGEHGP